MAVSTFHESTFAFFKETTHGKGPGWTVSLPYGTQAAWETAELAGTADRIRHFEADPTWIQVSRVEDDALVDSVFAKNVPITGLAPAEGGSIVLGLAGGGAVTSATNAITEAPMMTLLEHMLGGMSLGTSTTAAAPIVSDVAYDLTSATGQEVGQIIAIEDASATGVLYGQQIKTLAGTTATFDEAPNFTVVATDIVNACCTLYPSSSELDPDATDYSTLSLYYQKGDHIWQATGCKLQLDSITMARGELPKLNVSAWSTNNFPQGGNTITAPVWAGSVEGPIGSPVGIKTSLRISQAGSATYVCVDAESIDFQVGVPVVPLDVSTQCGDADEGRSGYTTQPADTTLTAQVFLDDSWQDDFDANQAMEVTIEQRNAAGAFWCIKLPLCYLQASPGYAQSQASNMQSLTFVAHENTLTNAATPALAKAKFLLALG